MPIKNAISTRRGVRFGTKKKKKFHGKKRSKKGEYTNDNHDKKFAFNSNE